VFTLGDISLVKVLKLTDALDAANVYARQRRQHVWVSAEHVLVQVGCCCVRHAKRCAMTECVLIAGSGCEATLRAACHSLADHSAPRRFNQVACRPGPAPSDQRAARTEHILALIRSAAFHRYAASSSSSPTASACQRPRRQAPVIPVQKHAHTHRYNVARSGVGHATLRCAADR
jgi:hypothetical protein